MRFSIYFMSPSQVKDQVKDKSIINYCSPMDQSKIVWIQGFLFLDGSALCSRSCHLKW